MAVDLRYRYQPHHPRDQVCREVCYLLWPPPSPRDQVCREGLGLYVYNIIPQTSVSCITLTTSVYATPMVSANKEQKILAHLYPPPKEKKQ